MAKRDSPGVLCVNCGCRLDSGERCDCEQQEAQRRTERKAARTREIIAHNLRMMEQAQEEWDYA